MSRKRKTQFAESALLNNQTFQYYLNRLTDLSCSMFTWEGIPDTVDARYIEIALFQTGCAVYFNDETIGNLCLDCLQQGNFGVYGDPVNRRAYSKYNNYQIELNESNSVMIWNNLMRIPTEPIAMLYARKLYNLDRIIDVNANAQKTPVLLQGSETQRLTLLNLYKQYDGNEPFIFGDKSMDFSNLKSLSTSAPYVSDKIYELKTQIWNEALTVLGISNVTINKKERLITDEVIRAQGGTVASRYSRLQARQTAADKINNMFGTNISVRYREDLPGSPDPEEGEPDE